MHGAVVPVEPELLSLIALKDEMHLLPALCTEVGRPLAAHLHTSPPPKLKLHLGADLLCSRTVACSGDTLRMAASVAAAVKRLKHNSAAQNAVCCCS